MEVANIYDNGPLSLVARIRDTVSILTAKKWEHHQVIYAEPWPRSSPLRLDMVAFATLTSLGASPTTITKRLLNILQVTDGEMLCIRFEPLDDVEVVVYEQAGTGKFNARNAHARIDMGTCVRDPYLASSTLFVMGDQRDVQLEIRNPHPVALPQARLQFWGYRYLLEPITPDLSAISGPTPALAAKARQNILKLLSDGDKQTVVQYIGPTTWIPAEGR